MKKIAFALASLSVCLLASAASAANVKLTQPVYSVVTPAQSDAAQDEPAPVGGLVANFSLTSDADILAIQEIYIRTMQGGSLQPANNLYNNSAGGDGSKPSNALIA